MRIILRWQTKLFVVALLTAFAAGSASVQAAAGNGDSDGKVAESNTTGTGKASAPDPSSPIVVELQELKDAVQGQTEQFAEHSNELESERAALREELDAIARLEAKLGVE